jgi:16S rRNA (uracil1498-N3)-methyltransferase
MSLPVHLVDLAGVVAGGTVVVEGDEAHHAVAVRRLRVGEQVLLTDGTGTRAVGAVSAVGKRVLEVTVESVDRVPPFAPSVTVVQALPKGERGELAVEVLTEVGVDRIVPWAATRSVAVWRGERAAKSLARWRATAREAAKQARRVWFPVVEELATTEDVAGLLGSSDLALVLHEGAGVALAAVDLAGVSSLALVVGPEGGLTEEELAAFAAAGAHVVRLGPEVLRTSTAGVAAVAALLARTSRWG